MKKDRRDFLKGSAATAVMTGLCSGNRSMAETRERPNILWLVSEDNSPWLGCYGDEFATTPNLDQLASEGVVFTNAYANAPVCAPARFTMHTGMYASSLGTLHMRSINPIPRQVRFFTEYLREAGYHCVNGNKTDYNTTGSPKGAWDDRRFTASLKGLDKKQPFFRFINFIVCHESSLHRSSPTEHDQSKVTIAPYHPDTPEVRHDYAQYYDQIKKMDDQVGKVLKELREKGLADDTIVFYFSDHGGVLPRSKRFLYHSGMHVPMIARFPEKYKHLAPAGPGGRVDRLVSFVDLAPTMLSLAGLPVPDHMQGLTFLGSQVAPAPEYVYGFRGRMDERYDMSRAVTDGRFKYIRNYLPHYAQGRRSSYLWKMPAMQSWEEEYKEGRLNETQSRFFGSKPAEELYDVEADPFEINNLAEDPKYKELLKRMREANREFLLQIRDPGFLHEAEVIGRCGEDVPFEMAQDADRYDLLRIMDTADLASERDLRNLPRLSELLDDRDSGVRYWAAIGCTALGRDASAAAPALKKCLEDESPSVRVAAAEALAMTGDHADALPVLKKALKDPNMYVGLYAADVLYNIEPISGPVFRRQQEAAVSRAIRKTTLNAFK